MPVELDDGGNERQRCAGAHGIEVEGGVSHGQIIGCAEYNVGDGGVELERVGFECLVIKGVEMILNVVEQKIVAHHASALSERLGSHVT